MPRLGLLVLGSAWPQALVRILLPIALVLGTLPPALIAFRDGPAANTTGGFGEPSCQQCHLDNALNAPGGTFTVAGVPARYDRLKTYPITVSLLREDLQRGGFQLAARFASGTEKGKQAGGWRSVDDRIQIIAGENDPAVLFVQHTAHGSLAAARGSMSWTVEWTPPAGSDPIEFSAAGNAANDDASPLGDYIYITSAKSTP
jgi:hypothetical protein